MLHIMPAGDDKLWDGTLPVTDKNYRVMPGLGSQEESSLIKRCFQILGIISKKVAHSGRFVAANELAGKEKASMDDVNGKGLWDDSVMRK